MSDTTAVPAFFTSGAKAPDVKAEMAAARAKDTRWSDPKNLRASYFAGDDVVQLATEVFSSYLGANALYGAVAYPSLRRYETEVIEILLRLFRAPAGATGSITTGGTESIFMAVKTARDWKAATTPNIVVPRTAHAAFDKAAALLGLEVRRMATSPEFRADVGGMAGAIDGNTIMIVGSAPPYAYGVVDPLPAIADLATLHGLWMHVDACVGGMVLPFARDLGYELPPFDFSLPAVTSVSIDLHKYGYAFHGCSALLLRREALSAYQRYHFEAWPVGAYTTMNFAGSRGGGPIASAWAIMRYLGYEGYRDRVSRLLQAKQRLMDGVGRIPGLIVFGRPDGPNCSFGSSRVDMAAVGEVLAGRGWSFARQIDPPGILVLLNGFHGPVIDPFLADLAASVREVESGGARAADRPAVYTV